MKGYYNNVDGTKNALRGGWFHTGDIGYYDEDGYLYIVDRVKDMIIRGGYNVYPRELEEVLMKHIDISLVAVIGVPHPDFGETPLALLVPKEGKTPNLKKIMENIQKEIARFKHPKQLILIETLPRNTMGKVQKNILRQQYSATYLNKQN